MKTISLTLALLSLSSVCYASTVTYTSQTSYNAATTGNTTVNFAGDTSGSTSVFIPSGSVAQGGVQFYIDRSSSNGNLYYVDQLGPHYGTDTVLSSQQSTTGDNLTILLPGYYDDLSLVFNSFTNINGVFSADPLTITLSNGYSFSSAPTPNGTYVFSGLTSTTSFNSLVISDASPVAGAVIDLDQLQFGGSPTSATPEPSGLVLLGTGILGAAGAFRRRVLGR